MEKLLLGFQGNMQQSKKNQKGMGNIQQERDLGSVPDLPEMYSSLK